MKLKNSVIASQLVYASILLQRYKFFFEIPIFKYRFFKPLDIIYQKCNIDMTFGLIITFCIPQFFFFLLFICFILFDDITFHVPCLRHVLLH